MLNEVVPIDRVWGSGGKASISVITQMIRNGDVIH